MWKRPLVSGMLTRLGSVTVRPLSNPLQRPEPSQRVLGTWEGQTWNQSANRAGRGTGTVTGCSGSAGKGRWQILLQPFQALAAQGRDGRTPMEGKEGDVVCPDFSQAWDMLCCALLRARLERAGLQEWNMGWVGIWLNNQGQMSSMAQSPLGSHSLETSLSDQPLSTTVEHFYDLYNGMKCIFN